MKKKNETDEILNTILNNNPDMSEDIKEYVRDNEEQLKKDDNIWSRLTDAARIIKGGSNEEK